MDNLKLYIAILDQVPSHMVPVLVAHSMLGGHIAFSGNAKYDEWLYDSFRKVTLKVNQKEFDHITAMELVYRGHENTTLEGKKSCLVVCPREEYPNVIKFAKLWTP